MQGDRWFDFADLRGGRNGSPDAPLGIGGNQVNEALNVDYSQGKIAGKRGGSTNLSLTFSAGGPFSSQVLTLARHVPASDEALAELWGFDGAHVIGRMAGAATFVAITPKDAYTSLDYNIVTVSFNGKLFVFGKTGVNRGQVWDGTTYRRQGLGPPTGTPTVVKAAGTPTDTRKYRSSVTVKVAGVVTMRSELNQTETAAQALAAQQATVTLVGAPGEGETDWELWGASILDNYATYRYIGTAAIGNTIVDNSGGLAGIVSATTGTYLVPPSAQFAVADDARILMGGANESSASYGQVPPKVSRVWWTTVLGDKDVSDDERVVIYSDGTIRNYLDIEAGLTGIGGPVDGSTYVFSYRRVWRFSPTGNVLVPYRRIPIRLDIGCIHHKSLVLAEDERGQTALYFASHLGIFRITKDGLEYCGWDNEDIWATVNLNANVPCFAVYHSDKHQIWFEVATGSSTYPDTRLVFHTRQGVRTDNRGVIGGWVKQTGDSCSAICGVMFGDTVGATMSKKLKPYISRSTGTSVQKCDTTDTTDNGTVYQSYIEKVLAPPLEQEFGFTNGWIQAKANAATLRQTITPDFGDQAAKTADVSLAAAGTETRIFRQIEDSGLSGIKNSATVRLGDAAAADTPLWVVDEWKVPIAGEQPL